MAQSIIFDVNCPHCKKSLMDPYNPLNAFPSIKLDIEGKSGKGILRLCSIYDCYDHKVGIEVEQDEITKFTCPHCNTDLAIDLPCEVCGANMVQFKLEIGGKVNICSRHGCKNHNVSFVDLSSALNVFYDKFGYGNPIEE
jgi:hypothetical protein